MATDLRPNGRKTRWLLSMLWYILVVFVKSNVLGQDGSPTDMTTEGTADSLVSSPSSEGNTTSSSNNTAPNATPTSPYYRTDDFEYPECAVPCNVNCEDLSPECLNCSLNASCIYGKEYNVTCRPISDSIICLGNRTFERNFKCRYCYQTDDDEQECTPAIRSETSRCRVKASPQQIVTVNCTVKDVLCLGQRQFYKRKPCNWTSGRKYSTALILSITVGGLGADRFYLGYWREGLGKFFSFGGIGVWTLVDVILIAVGYVGPADGSHYI